MATVTASKTWVSGETVTPEGLNLTAAPTVVVADNEVTTAKILDANVTNAKLASGIDASKLTTGTLPIARIANAAVTPVKLSQPLTLRTVTVTTSGTEFDFTDIPSWARKITVIFNQVSTAGSSALLVQVGSGSVTESGYSSAGGTFNFAGGTAGTTSTAGFCIFNVPTYAISGHMNLTLMFGNTWVSSHSVRSGQSGSGGGVSPSLSGSLDRVRLTTANGTDSFDAGAVNIMYEG
jgi:hypothetical protein